MGVVTAAQARCGILRVWLNSCEKMSDEPQRSELAEGENDANQSPEELAKFVSLLK